MQKASFSQPAEVRDLSGKGTVEVVKIGDLTVARSTFQPGRRWSEHVKPIVGGDSCWVLHHDFVTVGPVTRPDERRVGGRVWRGRRVDHRARPRRMGRRRRTGRRLRLLTERGHLRETAELTIPRRPPPD